MQTSKKSFIKLNLRLFITLLVIVSSCLIYWFYKSYLTDPNKVFYGMILNNLNTKSYIITNSQIRLGATRVQQTLVDAGANIITSRDTSRVNGSDNLIKTLSIGTPSSDYSTYQTIKIGSKSLTYNSIIGIWGVNNPNGTNGQGGQLYKAMTLTPFLFASPSASRTDQLINFIKQNKVYQIKSSKLTTLKNRSVIIYHININLREYSKLLNLYSTIIGYRSQGTTIQYSGNQTAAATISVDILTRDLKTLNFQGANSVQEYTSFGIKSPIKIPQHTISLQNLKILITNLGR